ELFFVLFSILFVLSLLLGLARHSSPETARLAGRLRRLGRRFNEEWFGLIVGNAFGALIAASVLTWVQQFSVTRMLFSWLAGALAIAAQTVGAHAFGNKVTDVVNDWFTWYAGNQF